MLMNTKRRRETLAPMPVKHVSIGDPEALAKAIQEWLAIARKADAREVQEAKKRGSTEAA